MVNKIKVILKSYGPFKYMNYVSAVIRLVKPKGLLELIHSLRCNISILMVAFNNLLSILFEKEKNRQNNLLEIPKKFTGFLGYVNKVPQTG